MVVCSILLVLNTVDVLSLRNLTLPIEQIVRQRLQDDPIKYSVELATFDVERVKLSNWLGLHVWPVPLWLLLAFLQTTSVVRRKYLNFHRWAGRFFLLLSLYMTFGYTMMFVTGEKILGEEEFYIDVNQPRKFFTFRAATVLYTVWWFVSGIKAYLYAKRKQIMLHKYWAWQFLATGFAVGTMRVFMAIVIVGWYLKGGENVYGRNEQDWLAGYSSWLGFLVSAMSAHVVVGREIAASANIKKKGESIDRTYQR
ncbi:hypothetical protein FGB62_326g03 [Gracilaria domingensis]|nr:hypothetical protein FGB62_326g03 [Gracilaria domingensis]